MSNANNTRKEVMSAAWTLVKKHGLSLADALRKAWHAAKVAALQALLRFTAVLITFRKVDGTVTTRKATRNMDQMRSSGHVPAGQAPKGKSKPSPDVLTFYSLTDNGWRSFRTENLISYQAA